MMITDRASLTTARQLVGGYLVTALVGAPGVFVFSLALTFTVAILTGPIEVSGWSYSGGTLIKCLVLGLGLAAGGMMLPEYIAHGRTRREFFTYQVVGVAILTAVLGVLYAGGYALESVVYQLMDWPQEVRDAGLYTEANQYPAIVLEYWLVLPTWLTVGTLVGAGFYRSGVLGIASLPVAAVLVTAVESAVGAGSFSLPHLGDALAGLYAWSAPLPIVLTCLGGVLLVLALTWLVVRDLPLRTQHP